MSGEFLNELVLAMSVLGNVVLVWLNVRKHGKPLAIEQPVRVKKDEALVQKKECKEKMDKMEHDISDIWDALNVIRAENARNFAEVFRAIGRLEGNSLSEK